MSLLVKDLRAYFQSGATRPLAFRRAQLKKFALTLTEFEGEILAALKQDLGKCAAEAFSTEYGLLQHEIGFARRRLRCWMRPRRVRTPLHLQPGISRIHHQPLGVALIIGAWNFPLQLSLAPLVGAIAAGNCAVVKPSELAPQTSAVIRKIVTQAFSPNFVTVVEGGAEATQLLLQEKFDLVFFTGSERVGRLVYQAASAHLTPTVLELGGKSPAIVTAGADLDLAARRIAWGKFMNCGQTCVAPDYVYVDQAVAEVFCDRLRKAVVDLWGEDPRQSRDYGRIVNAHNFTRLEKMLDGESVFYGGEREAQQLYFAPTILRDSSWSVPSMQEEIFGPILPVLSYADVSVVEREISSRPKPLAAYLFTGNSEVKKWFCENLSFGGGCINDVVVHFSNAHLPFGGVGSSGLGRYHGRYSFETFSQSKGLLRKSRRFDLDVRYPPYSTKRFLWLKRLLGLSKLLD